MRKTTNVEQKNFDHFNLSECERYMEYVLNRKNEWEDTICKLNDESKNVTIDIAALSIYLYSEAKRQIEECNEDINLLNKRISCLKNAA